METQFDLPIMHQTYANKANYEIAEINPRGSTCVLYFSSHGLYFPNTLDEFQRIVIEQNRFEWKRNVLPSARKVIFLRDVTKQWYLEGINARLNSIEKVCAFLKEETAELKIICVGDSAGGYAAALFGSLLEASATFCFSAQFSLRRVLEEGNLEKNPTVAKYVNEPKINKFYDLSDAIQTSKIPIYYFYPARCPFDIDQALLVKNIENVYSFAFDSKIHGQTCYPINFVDLFSSSREALLALHKNYQGKVITPFNFSQRVSGWTRTIKHFIKTQMNAE